MKKLLICLFMMTLPVFAVEKQNPSVENDISRGILQDTPNVGNGNTQKQNPIIYALGESLGVLEVDLKNPTERRSVSGLAIGLLSVPFLVTAESAEGAAIAGITLGIGSVMVFSSCYRVWRGLDD